MKKYLIIFLILLLVGCSRTEHAYQPSKGSSADTSSSGDDSSTPQVSSDESTTDDTSIVYDGGELPPENTDGLGDKFVVTGTDDKNNSDAKITTVWSQHLYSTHDKYHQVTCWYIKSANESWTLSCLPDSQVAHPDR